VLAVAVIMEAMAAPAFSKNIKPEPDGDGEPP
jgi:Tfp pilus assembly protein FimT